MPSSAACASASWWPACRNDNLVARLNSLRLYGALLEAGVELLEYNRTMMHHKTMVVDGVWATVGTTNFDSRSFAHNEENNVCLCDAAFSRQLNEMFARRCGGLRPRSRSRPGATARSSTRWSRRLSSFVQDQV